MSSPKTLKEKLKEALGDYDPSEVLKNSKSIEDALIETERIESSKYITKLLIDASHTHFPQFLSNKKVSGNNDIITSKIRENAREVLLIKKGQDLFDHDELTELYVTFEKNANITIGDEKFISYSAFKKLIPTLSDKCKKILNPEVFAKLLSEDRHDRVSVITIFNYVMRKTWLKQTHVALSIFDDTGKGFIREQQLESYITELVPTLVQLNGVEATFIPFYVCTAVRRFFFFLDPNKTGKIKILDILASGFIDELLDLREEEPPSPSNWFSYQSTIRVYGQYLNLDRDHNGMLSPAELV